MDNRNTIMFNAVTEPVQKTPKEILTIVYDSLEERGYNPIDQIVGFILSGDPSYITSYNNARNLIRLIDRDDLVEELVKGYLGK
ncbi:MAG: IreB family regulatory phosphoprotein [Eubacterium sp.]|nr:IreB family regulatory phosphoprotein [Eubacterium sp.]